MTEITYDDFDKVNARSGTIVKVEEFPKARNPSYKIWADFGNEIGIKQTSAQVTHHYKPNDLLDKQIVGILNLGTKRIAGFKSEFLMVGFADDNEKVCLVTVDPAVPNGKKLY